MKPKRTTSQTQPTPTLDALQAVIDTSPSKPRGNYDENGISYLEDCQSCGNLIQPGEHDDPSGCPPPNSYDCAACGRWATPDDIKPVPDTWPPEHVECPS